MQRQIDALVVRALAEQAAAQGVQSHLVAQALRIAEKMEGRPRNELELARRRRERQALRRDH